MRRHITSLVPAVAAVLIAFGAVASPASAAPDDGCAGDRVTASMSTATADGPKWSVTGACVDARDYFVGTFEGHVFAIGISNVTYDDGHSGRLAFLSVRLGPAQTVTVVGMEDPGTGELRFAGTVRQSAIGETGAAVSGAGVSFPPLGAATVALDFSDTPAPWPDWAASAPGQSTTTTLPASTDPLETPPAGSTADDPAVTATDVPATSIPSMSDAPDGGVPSVTTMPVVPGMEAGPTSVPAG